MIISLENGRVMGGTARDDFFFATSNTTGANDDIVGI